MTIYKTKSTRKLKFGQKQFKVGDKVWYWVWEGQMEKYAGVIDTRKGKFIVRAVGKDKKRLEEQRVSIYAEAEGENVQVHDIAMRK